MIEGASNAALLSQILAGLGAVLSLICLIVCSKIHAAVATLKAEVLALLREYVTSEECDRRMGVMPKHAARP